VIQGDFIRPIRCWTCGKLLGDKFEEFERRISQGENPARVLDLLGLKRYCCRAAMLTSIDLMDEIAKFKR
jgi:DNA-directed RNA polymerase subunit N